MKRQIIILIIIGVVLLATLLFFNADIISSKLTGNVVKDTFKEKDRACVTYGDRTFCKIQTLEITNGEVTEIQNKKQKKK